jgi:Cu+-exporting ATPase
MATVKDPVCGMEIESSQAPAQSEYNGTAYYFCSVECRALFEQNPGDYISSETEPVDAPSPQQ